MATNLANNVNIFERLLNAGVDANDNNTEGLTALTMAILAANVSFVKFLLDCGADVYAKSSHGYTALYMAAVQSPDNVEIFKLLLNAGADVHAECFDNSPLHLVA